MKYLNKRTGSVIIVPCRLEGPDWEEITEAEKPAEKAEETPKAAPKKKTARKGG